MLNAIILFLRTVKTSKTPTKLGKVSIKGFIFLIEGLGGYLSPDLFENGLDADEHLPYHTLR
jgi:hypothetical protein